MATNEPIRTERSKQFAGKPPEPGEVQPGLDHELVKGQTERDIVPARRKELVPFVLVENTTAKLQGVGLPPPGVKTADGKEAVFTGIVAIDPKLKLQPGINKVDVQDWELAKTQKMVLVNIRAGVFRELPGATSLAEINIADAVRVIPTTFDRKLLMEWRDTDGREEVQRLLAVQFDLLKRQHRDVAEALTYEAR